MKWSFWLREQRVGGGGLTLDEPSSPDGIIQTDLISAQQAQALKSLPFWGHYLATARDIHFVHKHTHSVKGKLLTALISFSRENYTLSLLEICPNCDKWPLLSAYSRHSVTLAALFSQCSSRCWVLRRVPLMWGVCSVARNPGGGSFNHAFKAAATLPVTL